MVLEHDVSYPIRSLGLLRLLTGTGVQKGVQRRQSLFVTLLVGQLYI